VATDSLPIDGPAPWVLASAVQVFASATVYSGVERSFSEPDEQDDRVRCVECGTEYALSTGGEAACPGCGCPTWISARIPGPALRSNLGPA
jgi:DNA-directed RNA polymerase subunit RPC12/RpoP